MADAGPEVAVERIALVARSVAHVDVRVSYMEFSNEYEVLFKHIGEDVWHEIILTPNILGEPAHEFFAPLIAHIKLTRPSWNFFTRKKPTPGITYRSRVSWNDLDSLADGRTTSNSPKPLPPPKK